MAQASQVEHNTTQFSCGRRVLRSDGSNHVNHCVHRVHIELTTKRLKVFPIKELQRVAPIPALMKVSQNHFDMYRDGSMGRSRRERDRQILVWVDWARHRARRSPASPRSPGGNGQLTRLGAAASHVARHR
jgi:hypothetical protein